MIVTHLGRTGLRVSRLCLGTMNFGPRTAEPDAHGIMDAALSDGINFFDTANQYGGCGGTEEIVGRWLAQGGQRREQVVLATKLYEPMGDGPNDRGLSAFHIRRACDESLRRLQTDHIDLYQMHHVDRSTTWDEIWQAMDTLVAQGKVIYVGSSNFAGWHIVSAMEAARRRGSFGLVSEQSLYNLTNRAVELEVLPACQEYGVGFMPWSPLAGGLLGGALAGAAEGRRAGADVQLRLAKDAPPATTVLSPTRPVRHEVEAYEAFCAEREEAPGLVALAWLLHQPAITAPVIGPRTIQQLREAERALDMELDEAALARLDEIWPGPGGTAPEAYAW